MKVMIVEDDRISALFLRKSLEQLGYDVIVATDGEMAWEELRHSDIQLVISDWMMPRLDGLELCKRVRAEAESRYVYFILLTAKTFRADRQQAIAAGVDDFLPKPLERGDLIARLTVARRLLAMEAALRSRRLELEEMHRELEARNRMLQELASSDALTGLKNRRYFMERLEATISFGLRQSLPVSLVLLDVDHFKSYNDTFGHTAGDEVLIQIAESMCSSVRDHDVVARHGGEEFVILLPAADAETSERIAERVRQNIADCQWPRRPITASFGVVTTTCGLVSSRTLIEKADQALYLAKSQGRNVVVHAGDDTFADANCVSTESTYLPV